MRRERWKVTPRSLREWSLLDSLLARPAGLPDFRAQPVTAAMASTDASFTLQQHTFMRAALLEAQCALDEDEVPVGCVIVHNGSVVGRGHNRTNIEKNATRHAEVVALDERAGWKRCWRSASFT